MGSLDDHHDPLARLALLLGRLPGIGEKSALRLALDLAKRDPDYLAGLSTAIAGIGTSMRACSVCCDIASSEVCRICDDARRDGTVICVVAQPQDRMAIERAGAFQGRYHVLHGVLDPLAGIGPAQLRIPALLERLRAVEGEPDVAEVIIATSPSIGGDATAMYLARLLVPLGITVSRIASGVATGGELEYADPMTLTRALADRRAI
jgi:recombination protein RecR